MVRSIAYYISLLHKDFMAFCNGKLQEMGLSKGLLFYVLYVARHPECTPKELAEDLQMDIGHTARSIVKLEHAGFLIQETNPRDRRSHTLRLTKTGEEVFEASHDLFMQWDDRLTAGMTLEEKENLMHVLSRLAAKEGGIQDEDINCF